ncbi:MAG: peptide/nickel transport system permease protein [Rhodothermales bacterium]|jgi:peptide/nickel transport system permease protein
MPEPGRHILRQLFRSRFAAAGAVVLGAIVLAAIAAPLLSPFDPEHIDIRNRLAAPSWLGGPPGHPLGTDAVGRDLLSRILFGARVSLFVGVATVLVGGTIGALLGVVAGYWRGWIETVIMRLVDIQLAFPSILLAVAIMAILGPSLWNVIFVLSLATWAPFCRVARAQTLAVCEEDYITASRAIGAGPWHIIWRHVVPNVLSPIIVIASFALATSIINEASLSFLGVGVPPTTPTWGGMLGEGRNYLRIAWWVSTLPGIALMLVVYSVNMLGDWLRDYLDPTLTD